MALASQKGVSVNAMVGDALNPPFADESFDLIIVSFMHFMPQDHDHFMAQNIRLLKRWAFHHGRLHDRSDSPHLWRAKEIRI